MKRDKLFKINKQKHYLENSYLEKRKNKLNLKKIGMNIL